MKLNKILTGISAVAFTSLIGAELSISPATAQSPRPLIVLVNGWGNCCAWGIADRLPIDAEIRQVPYSNFAHGGRSSDTSTDEQFLRDGANFINKSDRNRPLMLIGHSFGGDSVLKLLPRINRRIDFVAVIDPVSTGGFRSPLTRSLAVGSNVGYFFNRWQENVMFPNDFKTNGTIPCRASTCDQEAQNLARNADGATKTIECRWDEVTCPGFVAPNPLIGRKGKKGRKQVRVGHQDLPKDPYIQRILGERIKQTVAAFQPPSSTGSNPSSSACVSVDSRSGWQHFNLPGSFTRVASISGGWSVDTQNYASVGSSGHSGRDAEALAPYNQYKFDQRFPFGALLMGSGQGTLWIQNPLSFNGSFGAVDMRINDADNALGDNGGSLQVCFGN
ncbi:alpha/beta hydrolase [Trichocoleus sp. DQ-U1]|uniref:alpha/beta hydrolase n=1 Tax=Trichocoleus sp. DQ-U1 TaxID=2933926 RepID=UPI003299ED35